MFCANCGQVISDEASVCPFCGHEVGTKPTANVGSRVAQVVDSAANKLNEATGGTGKVELKFTDFFTEVPKLHDKSEIEHLFICGTKETTPAIENVSAEWPKPWVWSRVLLYMLVATIGCILVIRICDDTMTGIPSLMFMGALTVPISLLVFFFEINIPRNISIVEIISIFFLGGIVSILSIYFNNFDLLAKAGTGDVLASILMALIKETGKAIVITIIMVQRKENDLILKGGRNSILNGLLIGAAVGAGYSLFETAGYAFEAYFYGYQDLTNVLLTRGLFAIGMHTAWAAAEGAALALCESETGFDTAQLWDPRFLTVAIICVTCHALWIMYLPVINDIPFLKQGILTIVIWIVIAVLIHRGLAQLNRMAAGEEPYDLVINVEPVSTEVDAQVVKESVELIEAAPVPADVAAEAVEDVVEAVIVE